MDLIKDFQWLNEAEVLSLTADALHFKTKPDTDFWQRTYYGFSHDNGHMYLCESSKTYFSFSCKFSFDGSERFAQAGLIIYQDSANWAKTGIECENSEYSNLGAVVTNAAYSDWSMAPISPDCKSLHLRLSRRGSDFLVEYATSAEAYQPLRIFHLDKAEAELRFGFYACSPGREGFTACFSEVEFGPCLWQAHQSK